jgi:hypothetical protein
MLFKETVTPLLNKLHPIRAFVNGFIMKNLGLSPSIPSFFRRFVGLSVSIRVFFTLPRSSAKKEAAPVQRRFRESLFIPRP